MPDRPAHPEATAGISVLPVIVQAPVPVEAGDDAATLAARVQTVEHRIYPLAIRWFADGRVHMENDRVWLDNEPLKSPVRA